MNKPSATAAERTPMNSLKRKKPDDDVSPDTLRAEALSSKSVDMCIHCDGQEQ